MQHMKKYALKFLLGALPVLIIGGLALFYTPLIPNMSAGIDRINFALNICGIAGLFSLMMGVEAVAHDRLFTPAINPLANFENKRIKVNKQYLQNTLEQFVLFVFAVLMFTSLCQNGDDMRSIVAFAVAWTLSRIIFWIAYHHNPLDRIYGLIGMVLTMIVLIYSGYRFIQNWLGFVAGIIFLLTISFFEISLTYHSWRQSNTKHSEVNS